jgi:hypothetical protein
VTARLNWRLLLAALFLCLGRVTIVGLDLEVGAVGNARQVLLRYLVVSVLMTICVLTAVLIAERSVERGTSRMRAYLVAITVAAVVTGVLTMVSDRALGWRPISEPSRWLASSFTYGLFDTLVRGGLAGFLYSDYRRLLASTGELRSIQERHAVHERELADARLRAVRARVDPQAVLDNLRGIRERYRAAPPEAETELEALIGRLRLATARAGR